MLTVACVNVGTKYSWDYVTRLQAAVAKHLPLEHQFVCLTDRSDAVHHPEMLDISKERLSGWWAKLKLFDPVFRARNGMGRWLYFDLDTVILRDLSPLAEWNGSFGICGNFTRAAGHTEWPCAYGSCVMSLGMGYGSSLWRLFNNDREAAMKISPKGDQQFIEKVYPHAHILQCCVPPKFFIGYRDLNNQVPEAASVVVFAGNHKPDNSQFPWVAKAWQGVTA